MLASFIGLAGACAALSFRSGGGGRKGKSSHPSKKRNKKRMVKASRRANRGK